MVCCIGDLQYVYRVFGRDFVEIPATCNACDVIGDIRNMFFQIGLDPKDRDMLSFLPFTKSSSCNASNQCRFKDMPYGLICVPSIAGHRI